MEIVLRSAAIYIFLLVLFRLAGRRTLSETSSFDLVILLIIGESVGEALTGDDFSATGAMIAVVSLVLLDVLFSVFKARSPRFAKTVEGVPMIIVEYGEPLTKRMRRARIDEEDILKAARQSQGLERMDQIKFAILEVSGVISVIPHRENDPTEKRGQVRINGGAHQALRR